MMRLASSRSANVLGQRALRALGAVAKPANRWAGRHRHPCLAIRQCRLFNCSATPASNKFSVVAMAGLPFYLSKPQKRLKFKWDRRFTQYTVADLQVEVDALSEGTLKHMTNAEVDQLLEQLQQDAERAVPLILNAKQQYQPKYYMPAIANVSLVLCDDARIQQLNKEHRGTDAPTDVLSFEIPDEDVGMPVPVKLLGDLIISLDTAQRQADERGYSLLSECRVLLVHGLLHLCGFDHEAGEQQLQQMAQLETQILAQLDWEGSGLITAAEDTDQIDTAGSSSSSSVKVHHGSSSCESDGGSTSSSSSSNEASSQTAAGSSRQHKRPRHKPPVSLVALDMDGTLLDSSSNITPDSAAAIRAAIAAGVKVILATGKARPAAIAAARKAGLEGDGLLVSLRTPGIFLQGLAVHGHHGQRLSDAALPADVVHQAFTWATAADVPLVAFLGDECVTLRMTQELEELHTRYYEPLAQECSSIQELLQGPAVRKLLFMTNPERIDGLLKPHWGAVLQGQSAELLQAVPNMLEVVPVGVNKWAGLQVLLDHMHLSVDELMAVGDGSNDLQMVKHAGIGIAMGNAVPSVKEAAVLVVSGNDDGGIVEAFERFVL